MLCCGVAKANPAVGLRNRSISPREQPARRLPVGTAGLDEVKAAKLERILKDGADATLQNGAICFLPGDRRPLRTAAGGLQGRLQSELKRCGRLYKALVWIFSPVLRTPAAWRRIRQTLQRYRERHTILTLGSGPHRVAGRRDIINVDIFAFEEVDVVADARDLPIEDGTVDLILSFGVLEHVAHPEKAVAEIHRLLREDGRVLCTAPLMQPMHAAPEDFQRWTRSGLTTLFGGFEDVEVVIAAGPTSGALWPLLEWLALLLSFGSRTLRDVFFVSLMFLTWPLKVLDLYLARLPGADRTASAFLVSARK